MIARLSILLALSLVLLVAMVYLQPGPIVAWLEERSPAVRFDADVERPLVAVTIDDGPSESTDEILEVLEAHEARATFFLIGHRVLGHEEAVRDIVERDHEVGHHMWRDETSALLDDDEFDRRFAWTESALERFTSDLEWFRPGGGWYDREMIEWIERERYSLVLASAPPIDTFVPFPKVVARHLLANARPGAILVIHDGPDRGSRAVEILRALLPELEREGYRVVTVSELVSAEAGPRHHATTFSRASNPGER